MSSPADNMLTEEQRQELAEHIKHNFSPEEMARATSILSMYQPLLETANLIFTQLTILDKVGTAAIPKECLKAGESWKAEFQLLNEYIKHMRDRGTMQ